MPIATIDPSTGQVTKTFDAYSEREIDKRLNDARIAFESYRLTTFEQRAAVMNAVAGILDQGAGRHRRDRHRRDGQAHPGGPGRGDQVRAGPPLLRRPRRGAPRRRARRRDVDDALRLANVTEYGLGSSVWTRDPEEQDRFIRDLEAGMVFVNGGPTSYPELAFGGGKRAGRGREHGRHGL